MRKILWIVVLLAGMSCVAEATTILTCGPYALRRPGTCALEFVGEGYAALIYAEGSHEQCQLFLGANEEECYDNLMSMVRMIQREQNEYYLPLDDSTTVWYNNFRGRHYIVINRLGQSGNVWLYGGYIQKMIAYFAKTVDKERRAAAADSLDKPQAIPTDDEYFQEEEGTPAQ
ncbi:MAG: hypothetical protein J6Y77_01235 [Paludibacteraceae bacterium]|nr:hypothetical protein [Paludibacteraceae bacterium]